MDTNSAVSDTNIFVAALWGGRTCRALLTALEAKAFTLWISSAIIAELDDVLARDKFHQHISTQAIERLHHVLRRRAQWIQPEEVITLMPDPADNRVLECVAASAPAALITGDHALLDIKTFRGTEIMSPSVFLARLNR